MRYDPQLAEQRFGHGLSPSVSAPQDAGEMLAGLVADDEMAKAYPLADYTALQSDAVVWRRFNRFAIRQRDSAEGMEARAQANDLLKEMRERHGRWFGQLLMRRVRSRTAFRERLVAFWADHFTAQGKNAILRLAAPLYVDAVVRPNVAGRFADLLFASVTHPLMLHYLDQDTSTGPNSRAAKHGKRRRGLNENLAREVLELHTLGVGGPYTQRDVRQLAELFTGLGGTRDYGFRFRPNLVEPGAETVLGTTYAEHGGMAPIRAVLDDLAVHPVTARHIAQKLAVHFESDTPPDDLVRAIEQAFVRTNGDLTACYAAMLGHPAAWVMKGGNIRPPEEFMSASLRALDPPEESMQALDLRATRNLFLRPMKRMGQPWLTPPGPDGFAEADAAWVTPQGVSARLEWAMNAPGQLMDTLPEPRAFVQKPPWARGCLQALLLPHGRQRRGARRLAWCCAHPRFSDVRRQR